MSSTTPAGSATSSDVSIGSMTWELVSQAVGLPLLPHEPDVHGQYVADRLGLRAEDKELEPLLKTAVVQLFRMRASSPRAEELVYILKDIAVAAYRLGQKVPHPRNPDSATVVPTQNPSA